MGLGDMMDMADHKMDMSGHMMDLARMIFFCGIISVSEIEICNLTYINPFIVLISLLTTCK